MHRDEQLERPLEKGLSEISGRMSERLLTVANMLGGSSDDVSCRADNVSFGTLEKYRTIADVGCDHGYVSIYLVLSGIAESAIAMDVRKGPLDIARSNVEGMNLKDRIETRLSDGLTELSQGEADSLVIAGMGGKLMISILEKKSLKDLGIKAAVLQPQSDIPEFRQYLRDKGFLIKDERMVLEDGKYYFPMKVMTDNCPGADEGISSGAEAFDSADIRKVQELFPEIDKEQLLRICNRYGEHNILRRDPLLKSFLEHGREVNESILRSLDESGHPERVNELRLEIKDIELVLNLF